MYKYYDIISKIYQLPNTLDKVREFEKSFTLSDNIKIFLFDEKHSNVDSSFRDESFNQYHLIGLSDYTKTWVLDSKFIEVDTWEILFGKLAHFDLNVLGFLEQLSRGCLKNSPDDFIDLLSHLKKYKFDYSDFTSLLERRASQGDVDKKKLSEMLLNYAKFANSQTTVKDFHTHQLSNEDYCWVKEQYDVILGEETVQLPQYDLIKCLLLKAFLIKQNRRVKNKFEEWLNYSLDTLQIYLEFETFCMCRYFDSNNQDRMFKKMLTYSKKTISQISNTAWDFFHVRLMEQTFLEDNKDKTTVYFPYFVSNDQAFKELLKLNPVKCFVIIDDKYIALREKQLDDFCSNPILLDKVGRRGRQPVSHDAIKKEIENLILEIEANQSAIIT